MTDPDLQRLAELWTEPDAADQQEAFERLARRARLRGRIFAWLDFAAVAVILGGTVLSMFMKPGTMTMVAAIALITVTVIVTRKRRQIKQMTRALDTAGREAFIETSISNVTADLRRTRLSLAFFPPGMVAALTLKMAMRTSGHWELMWPAFLDWASTPRGIGTFIALALLYAWGVRTLWRVKRELRGLEQLRSAYAEEAEYEDQTSA
jgi:hypothetical protein